MDALIDQKQILAMAKQMLRLTGTDTDPFLIGLINQGARDLSTNETLIIKNCTIEVKDNRFYLPDDCKRLLAFRSKDSCIEGLFADLAFFSACGCNSRFINPLVRVIDIQGRWAHLITRAPDGIMIELAYQSVDTDEAGLVKVNEEQATALAMYCCYWYAVSYAEYYSPEQRALWKAKYEAQANRVRGLASRRKFEEGKIQIRNKINQMVNTSAPFELFAGRYTSFYYPTYF